MKIVLINFSDILLPNIGLAYVLTSISNSFHKPFLVDTSFYPKDKNLIKLIVSEIKRIRPHVIGFSTMSSYYNFSILVARAIKNYANNIKLIWGGVHPTLCPEEIIKNDLASAVFIGEAENSIVEYLNKLESGKYETIPGVWYKVGSDIVKSERLATIEDLDSLPFINWDFWDVKRYFREGIPSGTLPLISSRGCVRRCTYCSNEALRKAMGRIGNVIRYRSADEVIKEIESMLIKYGRYGLKMIALEDDIFGINKKFTFEFMDKLIKKGINKKIPWVCQTCADVIDQEFVRALKSAGCTSICLGLESGNEERRIKIFKKNIPDRCYKKACKIIKRFNIHVLLTLIVGTPGETKWELKRSIKKAWRLNPSFLGINKYVPLPKTALYEICKEKNLLRFDLIGEGLPRADTGDMTVEALDRYLNSIKIPHFIKYLLLGVKNIGFARFPYLFLIQLMTNWQNRNREKKIFLSGFFRNLFLSIVIKDGQERFRFYHMKGKQK